MNNLSSRNSYNDVAASYDNWYWQQLWRNNEAPILEKLFKAWKGTEVLDVGIGTGAYVQELCDLGFKVTGIDSSLEMIKVCSRKYNDLVRSGRLELIDSNFLEYTFDKKFKNVLSSRVLHHVSSLDIYFKRLNDCTLKGSNVVLTDIHPDYEYNHINFKVNDNKFTIPIYHFTYSELLSRLQENNFQIKNEIILRKNDLKQVPDDLLRKSQFFFAGHEKVLFVLDLVKI